MRPDLELIYLKREPWWQEQREELTELSDHILNRLIGAGFNTIQDVRNAGPDRLREINGIGNVALEEIRCWLRRLDSEPD